MEQAKSGEKSGGRFSTIVKRVRAAEYPLMVSLAVLIGVLGGLGAVGFRLLIGLFQRGFFGTAGPSLSYLQGLPWYAVVLAPAAGGLLVGPLVYFLAREAKGHGVPEVMEAVALRNGAIRPRVTWVLTLASSICIGSGGSVGREGPIAQIGSALGSTIGQFLKVSGYRLRTLVGCGAAAGIAATFNAPIAGALFAVEIILGDFGVSQFSPIVISSVTATVISRYYLGNFPAFEVPTYHLVSPLELLPYAFLGLLAALASVLFTKTLYRAEDLFDAFPFPPYLKPVIGGLGIGVIGLFFPQIFGVGYEAIGQALNGALPMGLLFLLIFIKMGATSLTIGSGGSGGIFAPSLFLGAMVGGFVGYVAHGILPEMTASPGAYSLVGMGALVSGTTHAPITAIIMMFELTGDYTIILPLMISCILSTLLSRFLSRPNIYTTKLIRRGLDISRGKEVNVLRSLEVSHVMRTDYAAVPRNMNFGDLVRLASQSPHTQYFIVDEKNRLLGVVSLHDLRATFLEQDALKDLIMAEDIAYTNFETLFPADTLDVAMHRFGARDLDEIPVVEGAASPRLLGVVLKNDVIAAYNQQILTRDMVDGVSQMVGNGRRFKKSRLSADYSMLEMDAPGTFIGKSIKELNLRAAYGVQIFLIVRSGPALPQAGDQSQQEFKFVPDPDYCIQWGDRLILVGEDSQIEKVKRL